MRKRRLIHIAMAGMLAGGLFSMTSCSDDISQDSHYATPDWLKGNAYEILQKEGKYSTFLKGIDLSGYQGIVAGKSILTVMAPDDDAFAKFLKSKGYNSIEEMYAAKPKYVKDCIGYHLMYFAFDWNKLVNFRPSEGDAALAAGEKTADEGFYYKHRTHSQDPIEQARVKFTSGATQDTLLNIYHYERYLPVFSNKLFESKGISAAANYNYFYPETEWNAQGGADGSFNVANAKVSNANNVISDNGYVYYVDHVIEPLNTIYGELKNNSNYSEFLSLYDSYSTYDLADDETNSSLGYLAYIHSHGDLAPIAHEWPTTNWRELDKLEKDGYNLFAPTNNALQNFFKTYWTAGSGYNSLSQLDPMIISYFIRQSFTKDNFIVFPDEIKKGDVLTTFGTPININTDEVTDRKICCNGALYGMDKMEAPAIFSSVAGPAFKDTTYVDYLYTLDGSNQIMTLASQNNKFVTLMPSNAQFEANDPAMRLYTTTSGKQMQEFSQETGTFVEMGTSTMQNIAAIHIATGISSLPETGTAVIETTAPFNYWYVNNGKITTNSLFNQQLEPTYTGSPFVAFHKLTNAGAEWDNGASYSYDAARLFSSESSESLTRRLAICNDKNYDYYLFAQLLQKAGLVEGTKLADQITQGSDEFIRMIAFIPTNSAITSSIKSLPGCASLSVSNGTISGSLTTANKTKLADYLCSYFIVNQKSFVRFTAYPYAGSGCTGTFNSCGSSKLTIAENAGRVTVSMAGNTAVGISTRYAGLPFVFSDGCLQFIDAVL